jgi:hypothetical protein
VVLSVVSCGRKPYLLIPSAFHENVHGVYANGYAAHFNATKARIRGEVISVSEDSIIIKDFKSYEIRTYKRSNVRNIKLYLSSASQKDFSAFYTINGILPLTHGFWSIVTYPMNIAVMSSISNSKNVIRYPLDVDWDALHKFARFPQGLPPNIDLNQLGN